MFFESYLPCLMELIENNLNLNQSINREEKEVVCATRRRRARGKQEKSQKFKFFQQNNRNYESIHFDSNNYYN